MIRNLALFLLLTYSSLTVSATSAPFTPSPEHGFSTALVTKLIKQFHYKKTSLSDAQSSAILERYLETLDPNRNILTLEDINSFKRYRSTLDNALLNGNIDPAFTIFRLFNQRNIERAEYALARLEQPFDFTLDEQYQFDRSEAAWPKNKKELDNIWRKRVKNDLLNLSLSDKPDNEILETLQKRYQRYKTRASQVKPEDVYEIFINAYLKTIEPHTAYFSPRASENFKIDMSLSLEGIGAVLQTIGDDTVVKSVVPGGPAALGGQLHSEDRISGVGQDKDGAIEDIVGWRIDDVVALIRGPKDSIVRLQVRSKASGSDGPGKIITIIRDKIKLEERRVQKSIIEFSNNDQQTRIGVITIPIFYIDFDAARRGEKDYVSTTRDTRLLLEELKAEKVDGIVINLSGNGGGSLSEAISLTGLFIKSGPVVQVQDSRGRLELHKDTDNNITYSGPLAVLVNRFSASASEIFAGAMQDYGRATIIGEPTFGKGTVQQILDLNRYVSSNNDTTLGQLKLTIAQFFRINGESTQNRGIIPDIIFSTANRDSEQGESSLENALPWTFIKAANFASHEDNNHDLSAIKARHQQRSQSNSGFEFLLSQAKTHQESLDKTSVTLLKTARKAAREKQEAESLERINRYRLSLGLEAKEISALREDEGGINNENDDFLEKVKAIRLNEAAAILADLVHLPKWKESLSHQETASPPNQLQIEQAKSSSTQ